VCKKSNTAIELVIDRLQSSNNSLVAEAMLAKPPSPSVNTMHSINRTTFNHDRFITQLKFQEFSKISRVLIIRGKDADGGYNSKECEHMSLKSSEKMGDRCRAA